MKDEQGIKVAIWPDGTWCSLEESNDFEILRQSKSDDYFVVNVVEWADDGSPADHYFS